ncbi:hypothetical protein [Acholeplasma hippikon]|uniref:Uncharacterized protein n=1 Tax=Acholeplasma hippikon TaxID=264636 RepID=A0A449BJ87_9MOLU|nr:hypothetical protein [Acholeplasma hippikon]VEU82463.1 Uncharacterised protein [Acholeplasma hippikon]
MSKEEFDKLKRNVQYTEAELAKMNGQLDKTQDKIKQLANAKFDKIGKLGSTLTKSVTVPILGAVSALTAFSIKSAYASDEIGDTAEKIGLSAEALQEWNHTATILGVSTERMERAFVKVNGILGDIATGNGDKYAESLALIVLSLDDLEGKNTDEAFNLIRDALSGVAVYKKEGLGSINNNAYYTVATNDYVLGNNSSLRNGEDIIYTGKAVLDLMDEVIRNQKDNGATSWSTSLPIIFDSMLSFNVAFVEVRKEIYI